MAKYGVKFITPKVRLAYPKLNQPDTKWKDEGEYVAKGTLLEGIPESVQNKVDAMLESFVAEKRKEFTDRKQAAKAKNITVKRDWVKPETDRDTGDETGSFTIQAKMKASWKDKKTGETRTRKPQIIDAKCNELRNPPQIWGGTEAKLAVTAAPYHMESTNTVGVTIYLEAVQIIKLVSGGNDAKSLGFSNEEGFEGKGDDDSSGGFTDESSDDKNDNTNGVEVEEF